MEVKKVKIIIISIVIIGMVIGGIILLKKNTTSQQPISQEVQIETNIEKNIETNIEKKIEEYIKENEKEYSKDVISGENSFYVGGIGKSIKSYNIENFKPEDFDIKGLIESVPESCDKFGAQVSINDEEIIVDIYTEKDKFYKKVEE